MRIGVTGHQRLPASASWQWVYYEMDQLIGVVQAPLVGISSLAVGADQLFANIILQHGGELEAIIPFPRYESTFVTDHDREEFKRLLMRCTRSEILEQHGTIEQAYFAAGKRVIDLSDFVVAVWDGRPARGFGGTADAVKYASQEGKRIVHLNPLTKTRREIAASEFQT
jgi:hypothetical protein